MYRKTVVLCLLLIAFTGVAKCAENSAVKVDEKVVKKPTARDGGLSSSNSDSSNDEDYKDDDSNWANEGNDENSNQQYEKKQSRPVYVKKQSKPQYQQQSNNNNPYDAAPLSNQLAQVIPANTKQQTLDQLYQFKQQNSAYESNQYGQQSAYQNYNRVDVLLHLIFAEQFDQWNPRNNNSQFEFISSTNDNNNTVLTDNAAFVVKSGDEGNAYGSSSSYGKNAANLWQNDNENNKDYGAKKSNNKGYVLLYSVPFNNYVPSNDSGADSSYYEGAVRTKTVYTIGPTQRFLVRMKSACKTFNADQHPFPSSQVANAWDDPRLVNCVAPAIIDDTTGFYFYIAITNTGVWAVYSRFPVAGSNNTALEFVAKRRIGIRPRYDAIVDGAVEIDNRKGVVNYYLNGYLVWTINSIGFLPPYDGVNNIDVGQGTPTLSQVSSAYVEFGTQKCLDESDPNNLPNLTRLVAILGTTSTYYAPNATFVDPESLRRFSLWGQGAIQTLIKLLIARGESVIQPQPAPLPGVYGPQAPKYAPQNNNLYNNNNNAASQYPAGGNANANEWD